MLAVSLWQSGRISVSHTGGSGFEHRSNPFLKHYHFLSLNSANSVKAFRENSNICNRWKINISIQLNIEIPVMLKTNFRN